MAAAQHSKKTDPAIEAAKAAARRDRILSDIPEMDDKSLQTLADNADRLERTGSEVQRTAATAVLPAIRAELAARDAARKDARAQARLTARAARKAPKATAPEPDTGS